MAEAVAEAIAGNSVLVAEAGTGTGKTFAYLVPALLSGGKVIISTGTKTLQDQLFDRDIPTVRRALKLPVTVALLKGRANYVCHHHLERALAGRPLREPRRRRATSATIERFARTSRTGDKADCTGVPENAVDLVARHLHARELPRLRTARTTTRASSWRRAGRRSQPTWSWSTTTCSSPISCCATKASPSCCPPATRSIFDEAHQLPETASLFFGESVSTAQLDRARARHAAGRRGVRGGLRRAARRRRQALDKAARDLRLAFAEESGRLPHARARGPQRDFEAALDAVLERLDALAGGAAASRRSAAKASRAATSARLALAERGERWRSGVDERARELGRALRPGAASQLDAALDRGDLRTADRRTTRAPGSSPRRRFR